MKKTSVLLGTELRLLRPLLCNSVETARRMQDKVGNLGAKAMTGRVEYVSVQAPFTADWAVPLEPAEDHALLYLHGGGYVAGGLAYSRGFGGILANRTQRRTLCTAYRLAPEHPFPAALDDAVAAYRYLCERYDPARIAVVGESAGGGLCFALSLRARELGLPLPGCIVAISPWTDLTLSQKSITENAELDPSLSLNMLSLYADMYAPANRADPLASPLFGDFNGFPPSMIFAGSHEILEDDARMLAKRLQEQGCDCTLHIEEGAWHAYVLYGIYEARQALERIHAFIQTHA